MSSDRDLHYAHPPGGASTPRIEVLMNTNATTLELANPTTRVLVTPSCGGRIQSVVDLRSGRELLLQREPIDRASPAYVDACTGGWDELFPADVAALGHPDHGRCWGETFEVTGVEHDAVSLRLELQDLHVEITRRIALLQPPRVGVRTQLTLTARGPVGPWMWASHPMLAVEPGWRIRLPEPHVVVDRDAPGRFQPGALPPADRELTVGGSGEGWSEVLYAGGAGVASVCSPDGERVTQLTYDTSFFEHLWVVTVSGEAGFDHAFLLEPSTSPTCRLDEAAERGVAATLDEGACRSWWVELESGDLGPTA
jgi:hypothetical protein